MTGLARLALSTAVVALLAGCTVVAPEPEPEPDRAFVVRELAAVGLTPEEYGPAWTPMPGDDGAGGGPTLVPDPETGPSPCPWVIEWMADPEAFATHSWRAYESSDISAYATDWVLSAAPGVDLREELAAYADVIRACGTTEVAQEWGTALVTLTPDIGPELGDASFSYRGEFVDASTGTPYAEGEVHVVVCGPLWIHLSYSGWEPFVERDALLTTLYERAGALGGCV